MILGLITFWTLTGFLTGLYVGFKLRTWIGYFTAKPAYKTIREALDARV